MERAHPIVNVPDLDTTKPFTLVPSEAVSSPDAAGYDAKVIVGHITGDACLKSAGAAIVSAVSAQAKIDSALFAPGASFINANGERYVEITFRKLILTNQFQIDCLPNGTPQPM